MGWVIPEEKRQKDDESLRRDVVIALGLPGWKRFLGLSSPLLSLEEIAKRVMFVDPSLNMKDAVTDCASSTATLDNVFYVGPLSYGYWFERRINTETGQTKYRLVGYDYDTPMM